MIAQQSLIRRRRDAEVYPPKAWRREGNPGNAVHHETHEGNEDKLEKIS